MERIIHGVIQGNPVPRMPPYGVKKFHMHLHGRLFILETDHKRLTHVFGSKDVPSTAAARMQRSALVLSGYQYTFQHRRREDNIHADMRSRLPVDSLDTADPE